MVYWFNLWLNYDAVKPCVMLNAEHRGSRSLQNLVAISQKYCQPLLTIKAGCMGSNGKNWLLKPENSSQNEG